MQHKPILVVGFFFLFSCINAQVTDDSLSLNYDSLVAKIAANKTGYHTLSARAKLTWDDGNSEQEFSANIRMLKDSIVWMSLSGAMGVEGARVFITPDTFLLINKVSNEYAYRGFDYLQSWLMFPITFTMLQQLIAGEKLDIRERASMVRRQDSLCLLYCETDKMNEKVWVDTVNYTIQKILLKDKLLKQDMTVTFDDYNSQGASSGKPFSHQRVIDVNRDGLKLKLTIEISKVKLNDELSYPFEVGGKFKRVK
jgi:hypothetical protein